MSVTIRVPRALRPHIDGPNEVAVDASDVAVALSQLEAVYPGLTAVLRDDDGALRPRVGVYVNDVHVRYLQGMSTPLNDGDQVYVVPVVMGG